MKDDILRLRAEGKSYRQIETELGCSKATIAYHLGEGQKQKTKDRTNRLRTKQKDKLRLWMQEQGCIDCKEKYPWYMLEFDHLPEFDKEGSPPQLLHIYGWDRARVEIEKCEVVCANCHKIRTYVRNQNGNKSQI